MTHFNQIFSLLVMLVAATKALLSGTRQQASVSSLWATPASGGDGVQNVPRSLAAAATKVGTQKALILGSTLWVFLSTSSALEPQSAVAGLDLMSDEVEVKVDGQYLGLSLSDVKYKESTRVQVDAVKPDAERDVVGKIRPGFIVVSVNGASVEGVNRERVAERIKEAPRPIKLVCRNPRLFFQQLNSTNYGDLAQASTQVLPANNNPSNPRPPQVLRVLRLDIPQSKESRSRVAALGDVVEIVYEKVGSDGENIGGMKDSTSDEATAFLALGSDIPLQVYKKTAPLSSAPKSTPLTAPEDTSSDGDLYGRRGFLPAAVMMAMQGMCIGERRSIEIPPVLQEGQLDFSSPRGINYIIRLISINGEA